MRRRPPQRARIIAASVAFAALAAAGAAVYCAKVEPDDDEVSASLAPSALDDGGCRGCNVLLITFESLRADHLECQGYGVDIAPNLCAFGETGVLFENAYSPAPVTIRVLEAIMTGDLVSNEALLELVGAYNIAASHSIAVGLGKMGYTTAGFTDHKGLGRGSQGPFTSEGVVRRGFREFQNFGEGIAAKTTAKTAAAVEEWLGRHRDEKFFLWAHLFDPHYNWIPGKDAERAFGFSAEACGRIRNGLDIAEIHRIEAELTEVETKCLESLYHAEVFETDALVGEILARLEALGLAERTIVIIVGDHGEEFGERKHIGHELTAYDELLHVPFMVRNPESKMRGRRAEQISTRVIHDYILGAVEGKGVREPPPLISRTFHYYSDGKKDLREFRAPPNDFAIYKGNLKLILSPRKGTYALYDRALDPGERNDIFGENPAGSQLKRELIEWIQSNHSVVGSVSSGAIGAYMETVDRLRALGYM